MGKGKRGASEGEGFLALSCLVRPGSFQVLQEEREKDRKDQGQDAGSCHVQEHARLALPFGGDRGIKHLHGRRIARLAGFGLLVS